jgi:hypothetical protein
VPSGTPFMLESLQTQRFCQVLAVGARQQVQCDTNQASAATFTYGTSGFSYQVRQAGLACQLLAHPQRPVTADRWPPAHEPPRTLLPDGLHRPPQGKPLVNPGSSQPLYSGLAGASGSSSARPSALSTCGAAATLLQAISGMGPVALASPSETFALVLHPSGILRAIHRATQQTVHQVGPFTSCQGPFTLQLLPCGALVLSQGSGESVWSSTSCCLGAGCYSSSLLDDGSLVIRDSSGQQVWSSAGSPSSTSVSRSQLQSSGSPAVACLRADPVLPQVTLSSPDRAYSLKLGAHGTAQLQRGPSGVPLWAAPARAVPGTTSASLCLGNDSRLALSHKGALPARSVWASQHAVPRAAAQRRPFVARISGSGCLEVLDATCTPVASTCAAAGSTMAIGGGATGGSAGDAGGAAGAPTGSRAARADPRPPGHAQGCSKPVLRAGSPCGGIGLCGRDAACSEAAGVCCEAGTGCERQSGYVWLCA